jgi:UDP-N-acetylglucosamine 2-epimerase (non-hydrolysing)
MIHIVIGTKAQLIKMAPVMCALRDAGMSYRYISTGQHRETMEEILDNFGLKGPDITLYSGPDITSIPKMLLWAVRILWLTFWDRKRVFENDCNGIVLVHGDTFSTLLGALIAHVSRLKVGHVESGLRSFRFFHPFPEELTRLITFRLSHYFFCPGPWAVSNLSQYSGEKIDTGGNTLSDALRLAVHRLDDSHVKIPDRPFAIVTIHRFENIYSRAALERIVRIVEGVAQQKYLLFILHKPTEKKLYQFGLFDRINAINNIECRQRYDYFNFIKLVSKADFVISDGGSNQEECYYLGKPVLLLRAATERQEGVGENCVISNYDMSTINQFVMNWRSYQFLSKFDERSPSAIISEVCREFAA